jgi:hypothetical protein
VICLLFFLMAEKVVEAANFFFVQLIEQEAGIYDKRHPDYARQDRIDFAWERVLTVVYNTKNY